MKAESRDMYHVYIRQGVLSKYIADVSVPISRLLGEAVASSTSIGVDVDAGGIDGATVGSVSMAGSWTASPASTGAGASDSWAARLPDAAHDSVTWMPF